MRVVSLGKKRSSAQSTATLILLLQVGNLKRYIVRLNHQAKNPRILTPLTIATAERCPSGTNIPATEKTKGASRAWLMLAVMFFATTLAWFIAT